MRAMPCSKNLRREFFYGISLKNSGQVPSSRIVSAISLYWGVPKWAWPVCGHWHVRWRPKTFFFRYCISLASINAETSKTSYFPTNILETIIVYIKHKITKVWTKLAHRTWIQTYFYPFTPQVIFNRTNNITETTWKKSVGLNDDISCQRSEKFLWSYNWEETDCRWHVSENSSRQ